jgi:hypothetical protein
MSKYGWERGTIVIPTSQWTLFCNALMAAYNRKQDFYLEKALALHERIAVLKKGKRGWEATDAHQAVGQDALGLALLKTVDGAYWSVHKSMFRSKEQGVTFSKPRRSDFPHLRRSTMTVLDDGEASLFFDAKARTVVWDVPENNHAVEDARNGWLGMLLFQLLRQMPWSRGSGGVIVGNDEYNQEQRDSGAGANYISCWFGPLGMREAKMEGLYISEQAKKRGSSL